jgi:hypothetical protein
LLVSVLARDLLVDVEKIAVALANRFLAQPRDRIREIEIHPASAGSDAAAIVASFLGAARRDVARCEVAEARISGNPHEMSVHTTGTMWLPALPLGFGTAANLASPSPPPGGQRGGEDGQLEGGLLIGAVLTNT